MSTASVSVSRFFTIGIAQKHGRTASTPLNQVAGVGHKSLSFLFRFARKNLSACDPDSETC
jgi:hypothetical protein